MFRKQVRGDPLLKMVRIQELAAHENDLRVSRGFFSELRTVMRDRGREGLEILDTEAMSLIFCRTITGLERRMNELDKRQYLGTQPRGTRGPASRPSG